ncbi:uncharacterized protein LOC126687639 [Mercurialis annua]|uniref:uncharacterized protein LOC126687639 n=1 Tax=Mercurialis annua TaxID=3986 RepID=UPI00215E34FE|nr:uncharacterized protein LOC126687639 [Mercurialis annua]
MAAPQETIATQVTDEIAETRAAAPNTEFQVIVDAGDNQICVGPILTSPSHLCDITTPYHDEVPPRFSLPHQSSIWFNTTFRNWPVEHKGYHAWVNRLKPHFGHIWTEVGIYDMISLCKAIRPIAKHYIMGASLFWSSAVNCFCFKFGAMTITLLDLAVMLNIPIVGERISPNLSADEPNFKLTKPQRSYGPYIGIFQGDTDTVPDNREHVAFLAFFISKFILCPASFRVTQDSFVLAAAWAEGRRCNVGEFLLAHLYRSLNDIAPHAEKRVFKCPGGPLWVAQLWLAMYFPELFESVPSIKAELNGFSLISSGTRLGHVLDILEVFNHSVRASELFCPILSMKYPPSWLLIGWDGGQYCGSALKARNLIAGLEYKQSGIELYCPNYVSRQFGFNQGIPCSLLISVNNRGTHKASLENYAGLQFIIRLNKAYLPPIPDLSRPSSKPKTTPEYESWWASVTESFFDLSPKEILSLHNFSLPPLSRTPTHADLFLLQAPKRPQYEAHIRPKFKYKSPPVPKCNMSTNIPIKKLIKKTKKSEPIINSEGVSYTGIRCPSDAEAIAELVRVGYTRIPVGVPKWHKDDKFDIDGDDEPETKRSRAKRPAKQKPSKEAKAKNRKWSLEDLACFILRPRILILPNGQLHPPALIRLLGARQKRQKIFLPKKQNARKFQ